MLVRLVALLAHWDTPVVKALWDTPAVKVIAVQWEPRVSREMQAQLEQLAAQDLLAR